MEQYAMGRLPEPELGRIEEHLLTCPRCRREVALVDLIRSVLRRYPLNGQGVTYN